MLEHWRWLEPVLTLNLNKIVYILSTSLLLFCVLNVYGQCVLQDGRVWRDLLLILDI